MLLPVTRVLRWVIELSRRAFVAGAGPTVFGGSVLARGPPGDEDEDESGEPIDVFLVAGQSNAAGRGESSKSPDVPSGTAYEYVGSDIEELEDPVGGTLPKAEAADTGSAWPAFANAWAGYGRTCVLVPVARGNTAQVAAADAGDGNWDSTGELRYAASDATNEAIEWLEENGYDPTLLGTVWMQGERDATAIDRDLISKAEYEDGLVEMIRFYRSEIEDGMPFYIDQTGRPSDGDTSGYRDVRAVQSAVADRLPSTYLATDFARKFPDIGLMSDRLHYTQTGYDLIGRYTAASVHDTQLVDTEA